jgi:hypothetical protein
MGEGVCGSVKTEISEVIRFRAERELADGGVDSIGSDHLNCAPTCQRLWLP